MTLSVGIPKEVKTGERRVSLTPKGVKALAEKNIPVYVEKNAGALSGFPDSEYKRAGAEIAGGRRTLWNAASLIKKVKEPVSREFNLIKSRHILFTYLHLASPAERPLVRALLRAKTTAIGYETIEVNGTYPLLSPMSDIAGVLAAYFAGIFRNHILVSGRKISGVSKAKSLMIELASQYPSVPSRLPPGRVLVIGGGHAGEQAARTAARMGGDVCLSEISIQRRGELAGKFRKEQLNIRVIPARFKRESKSYGFPIKTFGNDRPERFLELLEASDVIISAVHASGGRAPIVIDSALLKIISSKKKKIILDVAIDQGGSIAQSVPVDYRKPLYLDSCCNLRFCVTNIPSLCGRAASLELERVSLDYTIALSNGLDFALRRYPELKSGLNVLNGTVVLEAIRRAHQMQIRPIFS
jgi:alanine dehydrogenase